MDPEFGNSSEQYPESTRFVSRFVIEIVFDSETQSISYIGSHLVHESDLTRTIGSDLIVCAISLSESQTWLSQPEHIHETRIGSAADTCKCRTSIGGCFDSHEWVSDIAQSIIEITDTHTMDIRICISLYLK